MEAFVSLATNDSYALGAITLGKSLRNTETARRLALLITKDVSQDMRGRLRRQWDELVLIEELDSGDAEHLSLLTRPELGVTFSKIHAWRLTQYSKCVFLDADAMVLQNVDELFDRDELSAAPDIGWPDCFNSGVFVFEPSLDTFKNLMDLANHRGSFDGGDQGLLNSYWSDWATKDIKYHLPFIYNVTPNITYGYAPAFQRFGHGIKIIHFIGSNKPWHHHYLPELDTVILFPGTYASEHAAQDFTRRWWQLYMETEQHHHQSFDWSPPSTPLHSHQSRSWGTSSPSDHTPYMAPHVVTHAYHISTHRPMLWFSTNNPSLIPVYSHSNSYNHSTPSSHSNSYNHSTPSSHSNSYNHSTPSSHSNSYNHSTPSSHSNIIYSSHHGNTKNHSSYDSYPSVAETVDHQPDNITMTSRPDHPALSDSHSHTSLSFHSPSEALSYDLSTEPHNFDSAAWDCLDNEDYNSVIYQRLKSAVLEDDFVPRQYDYSSSSSDDLYMYPPTSLHSSLNIKFPDSFVSSEYPDPHYSHRHSSDVQSEHDSQPDRQTDEPDTFNNTESLTKVISSTDIDIPSTEGDANSLWPLGSHRTLHGVSPVHSSLLIEDDKLMGAVKLSDSVLGNVYMSPPPPPITHTHTPPSLTVTTSSDHELDPSTNSKSTEQDAAWAGDSPSNIFERVHKTNFESAKFEFQGCDSFENIQAHMDKMMGDD